MKHSYRHATNTQTHHHVTQLRNGGVGKDALDVILRDGDQCRKDRGDGANPCNYLKWHGRLKREICTVH